MSGQQNRYIEILKATENKYTKAIKEQRLSPIEKALIRSTIEKILNSDRLDDFLEWCAETGKYADDGGDDEII